MKYAEPTIKVKSNEIPVLVYKNDEVYKEFTSLVKTHEYFMRVFSGYSKKQVWDVINSKIDEEIATKYFYNGSNVNADFILTHHRRYKIDPPGDSFFVRW